jgi:uncharacterized protein
MAYSVNRSKPYPFRQFILKIHSRCDLACDYCYVYTMADQRWRSQPKVMSPQTMELTARRIAEHAASHRLAAVDVVLHGGEPLLAGGKRIAYLASAIRNAVPLGVDVRLRMQTNGLHLDRDLIRLLTDLRIRVGVSLDGGREHNDRHRRRPNGGGSYAQVRQGLLELTNGAGREFFAGLLCTIDVRNDPVATYEALLEFDPPAVEFQLPHGNWSNPPPGRRPDSPATPYADWLIAVFERWYGAPRKETRVRVFEEILNLLLGGNSCVEGFGLGPVSCVVVQTDGAIEQNDTLGSAYEGAAVTGLHVARNSFDEAAVSPGIVVRRSGAHALARSCRECDLVRVCGGGSYWHRYRVGSGFVNRSVYCPDLYRLIGHIRSRLTADVDLLRASRGAR